MPVTHGGTAPYAPPQTVIDVIEAFRDRGLATPFTADVLLRAGVTETLASRVLTSLKNLDLVAPDGNPTATLLALKNARGEDYKAALADWLNATYEDVLRYTNPLEDGPERIAEAFRGCEPSGQRGRMVTLMLGLFEYAGLVPSGKRAVPERKAAPRKKVPSASRQPTPRAASVNRQQAAPSEQPDLPPALVGLLQQVPFGVGWTEERRAAFLAAFSATLDFSVPVVAAEDRAAHQFEDADTEDDL